MCDITQEEIQQLIENIMISCWPDDLTTPSHFPKLTYEEAMTQYGSDKPDTRFEWKVR